MGTMYLASEFKLYKLYTVPSDLNVRLCDVGLKVILARKKEKTKNTIQ